MNDTMSNDRAGSGEAINLAERFAYSEHFRSLFREGMGLVEESATYLDGAGRKAARILSRRATLLYGTESMRLTTRLMQLASWLLLQRAASEGEMSREQLLDEKKKVRLETIPRTVRSGPEWEEMPAEFVALVERSLSLQNRIVTLDAEIYGDGKQATNPADNPVNQQIQLLQTALGSLKRG